METKIGVYQQAKTIIAFFENVHINQKSESQNKEFPILKLENSFQGRTKELNKLTTLFFEKKEKFVVICGKPGYGKSEIAKQFAYKCKNGKKITYIIWMNAESDTRLEQSCKNHLQFLPSNKIDEEMSAAEQIYQYFQTKSSMFVFDNVGDKDIICDFKPTKQCLILITSKRNYWGENVAYLTVPALSLEPAVGVLRALLGSRFEAKDQTLYEELAISMDNVPLALHVAANYIYHQQDKLDKEFKLKKCIQVFKTFTSIHSWQSATQSLTRHGQFQNKSAPSSTNITQYHETSTETVAVKSDHSRVRKKILHPLKKKAPAIPETSVLSRVISDPLVLSQASVISKIPAVPDASIKPEIPIIIKAPVTTEAPILPEAEKPIIGILTTPVTSKIPILTKALDESKSSNKLANSNDQKLMDKHSKNNNIEYSNEKNEKYYNTQKNGRCRIFNENHNEFIDGEWLNGYLVTIYLAQFQTNNNSYFRLYGLDNLYVSEKNNLVARIELPSLKIHSEDFYKIREEIQSAVRIIKMFDDNLKNNLILARRNFESVLETIQKSVTVSEDARLDMFHLHYSMQTECNNNEPNIIEILNTLSNNTSISQNLRKVTIDIYQEESKVLERNKNEFLIEEIDKEFSWKQVFFKCINTGIETFKVTLIKALPTKEFISSAHEDINKIKGCQLFTCSKNDIELFSDMELTTRQYFKPSAFFNTYFQYFAQDYVNKVWASFIGKINNSNLKCISSKFIYTNPVFLQLFKTFLELLNYVCDLRKEEISKIIFIKSNTDLCMIKNDDTSFRMLDSRLEFLMSLMNHFKPGDVKNQDFKYDFHSFPVDKYQSGQFLERVNNFLTEYSSKIPHEYIIWLYYIHKCFYDIICHYEYQQNDNEQDFLSHINSVMNTFETVVNKGKVSLEKIRTLTNSIITYGTTISLYSQINNDNKNILSLQTTYINEAIVNECTIDNATDIIQIYQVFFDESKKLFTDLRNMYSNWSPAVEEIINKFNIFTQYAFNMKIYNSKYLKFLRSFNEFRRLLRGTGFPWYIKEENIYSGKFVKRVDDTDSYIVTDTIKFIAELENSSKHPPKHLLFDLTKSFLSCVQQFMKQNKWGDSEKVEAGSELLLLMGRSLIDFEKLPTAADFKNFYNIFIEPFKRITQNSRDIQDFKKRLGSLENYYKYTMELNDMTVDKALQLCKQSIHINSPLDYTFDTRKLKTIYRVYLNKFNYYITEYILQNNIQNLVEDIKSHVKQVDISKWNMEYKTGTLPELLAGLSAVWSALESVDVICQKEVIKPHCIQILCVLRLLGADQAESGFTSHLAQVLTGQGKSLVLALIAAILALTNNKIRVVCYNQHLADRDNASFHIFYKIFDVLDKINYGTFKDLALEILNPCINGNKYDLKIFVSKLITNKLTHLNTTEEENVVSRTVLLIDEVDVFFAPEFYGNTYEPVTKIGSEIVADLQMKIWELTANNKNKSKIKNKLKTFINETYSYYSNNKLFNKEKYSRQILKREINHMISDAINIQNSSPGDYYSNIFKLRNDGVISIIKDNGEHSINTWHGYCNVFMYFKLKSTNFEHINFLNYGYLLLRCGNVSYAILPKDYRAILGVTGTLKQLSNAEMHAVTSYNISRASDMPTFFGYSKLHISKFSIEETVENWTDAILKSIMSIVEEERAVIVFFVDEHMIKNFSEKFTKHLSRYSVLTGNEDGEELARCVEEAGVARRVTITTRHMGRGVDFKSNDSTVEHKGGIHVIQTFFSDDVKEETQIKGRTARKDNNGSYEAILCREHLTKAGYDDATCSYKQLKEARAQRAEDRASETVHKIKESQQKHNATMEFLKSLYNYNPDKRRDYFKKYPFVDCF